MVLAYVRIDIRKNLACVCFWEKQGRSSNDFQDKTSRSLVFVAPSISDRSRWPANVLVAIANRKRVHVHLRSFLEASMLP